MAFSVFSPIRNPDQSMPVTVKPAVLSTQFSDGYVQEAQWGINPDMRSYNPTWTTANKTEADYIINFLTARGAAGKFLWTPSGESAQKCFVCPTFTYKWQNGKFCEIVATFLQRPNL